MSELVPPTREALLEAFELSKEILKNLELSELPLSSIALKTSRLARLLNDSDYQAIMRYEASGYPSESDGVPARVFELGTLAGRKVHDREPKTKEPIEKIYLQSIGQMEETVRLTDNALLAATDPDDSSEPQGFRVKGNALERGGIRTDHALATGRLAKSRALIYRYVLEKHYEMKFSGIADDVFTRIRLRVDSRIGKIVPEGVKRLAAIYENVRSENSEDWSNAAHGCRRLLQDLADAVFQPVDAPRTKRVGGRTVEIELGKGNYINRLLAFVEDNSESGRFREIVGSQIGFLGDRLDAVFKAAQKGSHSDIVTKEEADRCVVYTYLLVGDILSLVNI